jgi:hypothetical protein
VGQPADDDSETQGGCAAIIRILVYDKAKAVEAKQRLAESDAISHSALLIACLVAATVGMLSRTARIS